MENLTANRLMDEAFEGERVYCEMIKGKKFEEDVKRIYYMEKIIDYRCYLSRKSQIIYYIVETKYSYLAFKEVLSTRKVECYQLSKKEFKESE